MLVAGCAPQERGGLYDDVDINRVTPLPSDADGARIFLGSQTTTVSGSPVRIGWVNDDEGFDAAFHAAAELVNVELGGVAGRPLETAECADGETGIACSERLAAEGVPVVVLGRTSTPHTAIRQALGDTPALGIDTTDPAAWVDDLTTFLVLGNPTLMRAGVLWAERSGHQEVHVLSPDATSAEGLQGNRPADVTVHVVENPAEELGAVLDRVLELGSGRVAIVNGLGEEGCIALARALSARTDSGRAEVFTGGVCADREVHEELGDWPPGWFLIASGPDLERYERDEQVQTYRDRLERYAGAGSDWTGANSLAFAAVLNVVRLVSPGVGAEDPLPRTQVETLLRSYDGPAYMGMPSHRCGSDPLRPSLCVDLVRVFRYTGQRTWQNLSGDPFSVNGTTVR